MHEGKGLTRLRISYPPLNLRKYLNGANQQYEQQQKKSHNRTPNLGRQMPLKIFAHANGARFISLICCHFPG
jgi:hypothetical protein